MLARERGTQVLHLGGHRPFNTLPLTNSRHYTLELPKTRADRDTVQGVAGAAPLNPADVSCVAEKGSRQGQEAKSHMKYTFWLADGEKKSVLGFAAGRSMNSKRGMQQHSQTAEARAKEDTDCTSQGL